MSGTLSQPVGAEEFAELLGNFAPLADKIAVAVSGGPDSMALAFCLKRWAQRDITALIVDHGLRACSGNEAAQVKIRLEQLGLQTEILQWEHTAVTARLHEKARAARYRLLTDACRRHKAGDLLIAHHSADQAETILMRLAKGSGIDGLAGMAAQSQRDGIRFLRPLLSLSKERLIATCEEAHIAFVTDPSNLSEKYARGRLRKIMPLLAKEGLTVESLTGLGVRAAEAKDALDHYTGNFLQSAVKVEIGGSISTDRKAWRDVPRAIGLRAFAACLRYVHDGDYPPEYAALSALLDAVLDKTKETITTLYGCIASIGENKISLLREPCAAAEIIPLQTGETVLWDKRWLVTAGATTPSGTLRALGLPPHDQIDLLAPTLRRQIPQGRVRASLPALWDGDKLCAIPSFDEKADFRLAYCKRLFP